MDSWRLPTSFSLTAILFLDKITLARVTEHNHGLAEYS